MWRFLKRLWKGPKPPMPPETLPSLTELHKWQTAEISRLMGVPAKMLGRRRT